MTANTPSPIPTIRQAPPGELRVYSVYEYQLDLLAQGSPASVQLNYALFFLGVSATALGTLVTAPPESDRVFYSFFILLLVALIAGCVLLTLWWQSHRSSKSLVAEIKAQMPP